MFRNISHFNVITCCKLLVFRPIRLYHRFDRCRLSFCILEKSIFRSGNLPLLIYNIFPNGECRWGLSTSWRRTSCFWICSQTLIAVRILVFNIHVIGICSKWPYLGNILKYNSLNEYFGIFTRTSQKVDPIGPINNYSRVMLYRGPMKHDIWYCIALTEAEYISVSNHKLHPITRPNGRAMGCILLGFGRKLIAL